LPWDALVFVASFFLGIGFGNAPVLFAQISAEVPLKVQGRVNGANYAVMTMAWALGPFAYWYCVPCMHITVYVLFVVVVVAVVFSNGPRMHPMRESVSQLFLPFILFFSS
jgi:MFS family permease